LIDIEEKISETILGLIHKMLSNQCISAWTNCFPQLSTKFFSSLSPHPKTLLVITGHYAVSVGWMDDMIYVQVKRGNCRFETLQFWRE